MKSSHAAAMKQRRAAREQAKKDVTDYALAGLRRPHYAGVFRKIEGAATPTFLAKIELDGFERHLEIRISVQRDKAGQRYLKGLLSGVSLLSEARRFELTRDIGGADRYSGTIGLHGACLIVSVLPITTVNSGRIYLCHMEVLRETTDTGCRR
ncbi:hypothetical protein [Roseovarius pacificus]|uniref:hypothetical protein n=1 Tax=Roseovarius pacificus TaxID=337701 RepID=UPI004039FB27